MLGAKFLIRSGSFKVIIAVCSGTSLTRSQIGNRGLKRIFPLLLVLISDFFPRFCVVSVDHHSGMPGGTSPVANRTISFEARAVPV